MLYDIFSDVVTDNEIGVEEAGILAECQVSEAAADAAEVEFWRKHHGSARRPLTVLSRF